MNKCAKKQNVRLWRTDNRPPNMFLRLCRKENRAQVYTFALGELDAATALVTAPAAAKNCAPKHPCCGKPHMAFGECCGKQPFQPKCCASAPAQQVSNALVCTAGAPRTPFEYAMSFVRKKTGTHATNFLEYAMSLVRKTGTYVCHGFFFNMR